MACDCSNNVCLQAFWGSCSDGVEIDIVANQTGNWTGLIEFNGMLRQFTIAVVSGQKISIPTNLLNENYYHKLRLYNTSGTILNDTCYTLHSLMLLGESITPLPPVGLLEHSNEFLATEFL